MARQELGCQDDREEKRVPATAVTPGDRPGEAPGPGHPATGRRPPEMGDVDDEETAGRPRQAAERGPRLGRPEAARGEVGPRRPPERVQHQTRRVSEL